MQFFVRRPFDVSQRLITPEAIFNARRQHRREFLAWMGLGIAGASAPWLAGCNSASDEEIVAAGKYKRSNTGAAAGSDSVPAAKTSGDSAAPRGDASNAKSTDDLFPAKRNDEFKYGRDESDEIAAARYTNFYEFSLSKETWRYVSDFNPSPWTIKVDGLCNKPQTIDVDALMREIPLEERCYRHRCVETWAMCVPWTGFQLSELLKRVEPKATAKYVRFETFMRPNEAPRQLDTIDSPWPYTEGLSIAEAMNELAFLAVGIYGHELPKQHGAPIRLVAPWKYGFKSIKSIVRMTLQDTPPATFWNTLIPHEYSFEANVNPEVDHPRWSQRREWMLGTREDFETKVYNGYGEYVAKLYQG